MLGSRLNYTLSVLVKHKIRLGIILSILDRQKFLWEEIQAVVAQW